MHRTAFLSALSLLFAAFAAATSISAQAPGVPVYPEARTSGSLEGITKKANELRESGALLPLEKVTEQMSRTTCELTLPPASTKKLENRELWQISRQAHLRVGWHYLCKKCNNWHLNLAGGYAITQDAVVTCGHVLENDNIREGYLIVVDENDHVFPVAEVLAANRSTDTAIIRVKESTLHPLPLTQDVMPGDRVFCFSEPKGRRGYFSEGIVNRFTQKPFRNTMRTATPEKAPDGSIRARVIQPGTGGAAAPGATGAATTTAPATPATPPAPAPAAPARPVVVAPSADDPIWAQVSSSWAPGSSGSAVLDEKGNAIGHVSQIQTIYQEPKEGGAQGTLMVLHDAITAQNVLKLIKGKPRSE